MRKEKPIFPKRRDSLRATDKNTIPDFKILTARGRIFRSGLFFLNIAHNNLPKNRYAIVVPGKVLNRAVARNLMRRRFRGLFREQKNYESQGFDIVVTVTKKEILKLSFRDLRATLERLLKETKIL